jgi:hypothetical protein
MKASEIWRQFCNWLRPEKRSVKHLRMCGACGKQILRHHRWSRKPFPDGLPRHHDCADPTLAGQMTIPEDSGK